MDSLPGFILQCIVQPAGVTLRRQVLSLDASVAFTCRIQRIKSSVQLSHLASARRMKISALLHGGMIPTMAPSLVNRGFSPFPHGLRRCHRSEELDRKAHFVPEVTIPAVSEWDGGLVTTVSIIGYFFSNPCNLRPKSSVGDVSLTATLRDNFSKLPALTMTALILRWL